METCGCVAQVDPIDGQLTLWATTQAPHAHRTVYALVAGLPEHKIRVIAPDIGGGFGNKVGVYPGYVCTIVAALVTGKPVKWMEDRSENLCFGVACLGGFDSRSQHLSRSLMAFPVHPATICGN
jgi:aerobic carbon-monoxide dehydrogenase large subunit